MDNFDIYSIKPVDNSVISCIYETFSDRYAWPIHLSKLHGIPTTDPYDWIKPGYLKTVHSFGYWAYGDVLL